jgi:hypothetical protein
VCLPWKSVARDAPATAPQNIQSPEDTPVTVGLYANDVEGEPISYLVTSGPSHGTLGGMAPELTYTPNRNYVGTDHFSYVASDGTSTSTVATITIMVTPVNDAPVAYNTNGIATEDDWSNHFFLTGADPDGDTLTFAVVTPPAHGTIHRALLFYSSEWWIYRPDPNYNGPDSFTFTVSDGVLTSTPATFSITVAPSNDPPVATGQSLATLEDSPLSLTAIATDIDGDTLSYSITTPPAHGSVTGTGPAFVYSPAPNFNGTVRVHGHRRRRDFSIGHKHHYCPARR